MNDLNKLARYLNKKVDYYNQPSFINSDPISIPHRFTLKQDIEIAGLFAALLAWGNRTSIIASCNRLIDLMDNQPYQFIIQHDWSKEPNINPFLKFVHRTFNGFDLMHLLNFLKFHYKEMGECSLETAFTKGFNGSEPTVEKALSHFQQYVFSFDADAVSELHCRKHIATPVKKSACKRLNMYLRWMVRMDDNGVDFGLWKSIQPSQLICPLDVHVGRVARHLGLLHRKQSDWQAAMELTNALRQLDPLDPVKYDFALFGIGVMEKNS